MKYKRRSNVLEITARDAVRWVDKYNAGMTWQKIADSEKHSLYAIRSTCYTLITSHNSGYYSKGKKRSLETCAAISRGKKGVKFTEEHRRNIGLASKGSKPCEPDCTCDKHISRPHTQETKEQISATKQLVPYEQRVARCVKAWADMDHDARALRVANALNANKWVVESKAERLFMDKLRQAGVDVARKYVAGLHPDAVLPGKLIIEYNGCYWHWHDCGVKRHNYGGDNKHELDAARYKRFEECGYETIVVWGCEDEECVIDKIKERVSSRS